MFRNEVFREIDGYDGAYFIGSRGTVVSQKRGSPTVIRPRRNSKGYLQVNLCKKGVMKTHRVHRLVASHFIPNPEGYAEVNHRDEDKTNNSISNLEWCTRSHNVNYGTRTARQAVQVSIPVCQFSLKGDLLAIYRSCKEAERQTGIGTNRICACCLGSRKTAGGYIWKREAEVMGYDQ